MSNEEQLLSQENLRNIQGLNSEGNRLSSASNDNRPQIANTVDRFNKELTNSEIAYINKIYHKNNKSEKKTIMDLTMKEIMNNTANYFNEFPNEYSNKIYDTELHYSDKYSEDMDFFDKLKIYIIAFVRYTTESDNIIYLGVILIIISIILYFISIINK